MAAFRRPESVLVVVYSETGEVLLMERDDRPGFWQSVTGSLNEGEQPAAAAKRELFEETGLDAEPVDLHTCREFEIFPEFLHRFAPGVTRNLEHAFALALPWAVPVRLDLTEHLRYRWLPWREAAALTESWTNREVIESLFTERGND